MKLGTERRVGASEVAALLGLTPTKRNACDVYARIVYGIDQPRTKSMERGVLVEKPVLRRLYVESTGATLMEAPTEPWILQHPEYEWATCSPDGVVLDDTGQPTTMLELKSQAWPWALSQWQGDAPKAYVVQTLFAMWVAGLSSGHLFPVFGVDVEVEGAITSQRFEVRQPGPRVEFVRDAEMEQRFIEVCGEFWARHVVPRVPPEGEPVKNKRKWRAALKQQSNERKAVNE